MSLDDPPFANRLHTNYVPSEPEILEIRDLLVGPAEELARVEAQIKAMEIALDQLKEQRASLRVPIDAHKALISPMRCIPQDILVETFLACLPSEHNALIDSAEAPLVLGRICRHWRSVAYSTPMLWSSIHIPSLDHLDVPPEIVLRLERMVEAWLNRSATCSLSVSFFGHPDHSFHNSGTHPLILQLLSVSRRLRNLTPSGHPQLFRPLLRLGPEDLPLLKSISVESPPIGDWFDETESVKDSLNALQSPTLEGVALHIYTSTDPLALPLLWSQLTRLHLTCFPWWGGHPQSGGLDIGEALDVLRRCPILVQCEIRVTKGLELEDPGVALNTSPIILPHMDTLVLSGWAFHFHTWISHLVVPSLRSLQVGDLEDAVSSSTQNRHMSADIDTNHFTPSALHEFLLSFPLISHLRLSAIRGPGDPASLHDAILALFCPPHNLCPMLTNITVMSPYPGLSDAAALAFIEARMATPIPLQQFRAHFGRPMELDIMPDLQSFISDGLQVDLIYPSRQHWEFRASEGLERTALLLS